jgi:hypothetical protein
MLRPRASTHAALPRLPHVSPPFHPIDRIASWQLLYSSSSLSSAIAYIVHYIYDKVE